jgi:hypothetical protein
MKPISTSPTPLKPTNQTIELQEKIRRRAYDLYEQRGRTDGHNVDDWVQAETEIQTKTVAAYGASAATSRRSRS